MIIPEHRSYCVIMLPPLQGRGIKRWCASDVCLSCTCLSQEQRPRKTKIGTEVAHVSRDSNTTFKVKGQLAGGGAYCGGLPHSLFHTVIWAWNSKDVAGVFFLSLETAIQHLVNALVIRRTVLHDLSVLSIRRTVQINSRPTEITSLYIFEAKWRWRFAWVMSLILRIKLRIES